MKHKKLIVVFVTTLVICGAVLYVARSLDIDANQILTTIGRFSVWYLAAAFLAIAAQIAFQVTRLWALFPRSAGVGWLQSARAFTYGQFINNFVPVRAGDVVKIIASRKGDDDKGRPLEAAEATGIVLADKVVDTGALVLLILAAVILASTNFAELNLWENAVTAVWVLVGISAVGGAAYLYFRNRSERVVNWFHQLFDGLNSLRDPKRLQWALIWGLGCWLSELIAIHILCTGQGFHFSFSQTLMVLVILNIGVAIPISFANLGTFEAAMAFALIQLDMPLAPALAIATVHHAGQMLGIALWAFGAWLVTKVACGHRTHPLSSRP